MHANSSTLSEKAAIQLPNDHPQHDAFILSNKILAISIVFHLWCFTKQGEAMEGKEAGATAVDVPTGQQPTPQIWALAPVTILVEAV